MSRTTLPLLPILCLLIFSLPLIILATFTTILAFSALALRVSLVYLEMGIALLQSAFSAPTPAPVSRRSGRGGVDAVGRVGAGQGVVVQQRKMGVRSAVG